MNEEVYYKPNAKIVTKEFGEIDRSVYKVLVESYALIDFAKRELKNYSIPIDVNITSIDEGFFKDFLDRKQNLRGNESITDEQSYFELDKKMRIEKAIIERAYATLNR